MQKGDKMAKILYFKQENERRFIEWAHEWLTIPEDIKLEPDFIIAFLIANEVFTIEEIRAELSGRKIVLPEFVFKSALMINEKADLRQERSEQ